MQIKIMVMGLPLNEYLVRSPLTEDKHWKTLCADICTRYPRKDSEIE
jgi:hypothetical protein